MKSLFSVLTIGFTLVAIICLSHIAAAQPPRRDGTAIQGQAVSREVREIYDRGLGWLTNNQDDIGTWKSTGGEGGGAGGTGLALMAFLDPEMIQISVSIPSPYARQFRP